MTAEVASLPKRSESSDNYDTISSAQAQRGNPLPTKITSVLSAAYADSDIRDALSLLDGRGLENKPELRRQLRLDVQKEVIKSNGDIIQEFGHVAEQLRRIGLTMTTLNLACDEMKAHIHAARQDTAPVLEEASELKSQKEDIEEKHQLLDAFSAHFVMSDDDLSTLTLSGEPVNDTFFALLARAKKIQADCEVLLGTENQRLGSDIMEQMTKTINQAFQKLYRWIQRELKSLNLENPQMNTAIRRALKVLAERPSLFQSCLDFFAEARENVLSDAFYTALTGSLASGEVDSSVKPIELTAHDPLRYVGDMLAWTHSATVSEREALEALFISDGEEIAKGIKAGRENEPWIRVADESADFDGLKALNELVDRDVAGVARALRQRIGQVVQTHEETNMAYKLANILQFYRYTFSKLLGDESILLESLQVLEESAMKQFRALVRDQVAALQTEIQMPTTKLSPPNFLQDALNQLTVIMKTYESAFTSTSREADFQPILVEAFTPFITSCDNLARGLEHPDRAIFQINCLITSRSKLAPFDFTDAQVALLTKTLEELASLLIEHQHEYFRTQSGLQFLLQALAPLSDTPEDLTTLRKLPMFQPEALTKASQTLDEFLPSALMDAMENLKHLQSTRLARDITEEAAERFCDDFESVEQRLVLLDELGEEKGEAPQSLRTLFPRTNGEIRVLLS